MGELPFMTVLSLLELCIERKLAHLLDACFKSLHYCSLLSWCVDTLFNALISV